ncbi:MAG TPA: phosphoenolpyruvate--protein phosphotransferase [Candidatus Hydrogenedentes bacterium]|nr:phosphoenolpyruvate--protein phosphotransferase [Candidatus Hydrogenedentota bacterium]HPX87428.1 phosphoenolpyruvate--protein phosphotransferase [Candidatus Hydrogenedentota bacterium]
MEIYLQGMGVSPGIAIAPALFYSRASFEVPRRPITDVQAELMRLDEAVAKVRRELTSIYKKTVDAVGKAHAEIFRVHLMILDDVALRDDLAAQMEQERLNVEFILSSIASKYTEMMNNIDDQRFRERTADLLDVVDRLQRHLLKSDGPLLRHISEPSILVAQDLAPSDTASLDLDKALGLLVETGSPTSHSAILARALEIPAVVGISISQKSLSPGSLMILDGTSGVVIINPSQETVEKYRTEQQRLQSIQSHLLESLLSGPACTKDGTAVTLESNIELPLEIKHSLKMNVQGVGLYRTEYLFFNRDTLPTEEEQYQAYLHVASELFPAPVTLRTMDIGGDKFVKYLQNYKDSNPQLGLRAIRLSLAYPDIFKVQLRAMLRASAQGNIRIMFPMISSLEELRHAKAILQEARQELSSEGVAYNPDLKVGSMIEVPSAAVQADQIAEECDFFSLGTNDLIQYLLAVDRVNEKIAHLYEPAHPAVIRMIANVSSAAAAHNIPCSICGEMAGDPLYTELLLGLGVSSFSMASVSIPLIRARIAALNREDAKHLARDILQKKTAEEIKTILRSRLEG